MRSSAFAIGSPDFRDATLLPKIIRRALVNNDSGVPDDDLPRFEDQVNMSVVQHCVADVINLFERLQLRLLSMLPFVHHYCCV